MGIQMIRLQDDLAVAARHVVSVRVDMDHVKVQVTTGVEYIVDRSDLKGWNVSSVFRHITRSMMEG